MLRAAPRYRSCNDGSTAYHSTYLRLLASTYRYNEIRSTDRLTYSVRSAGPAELNSSAASVQLKYTNLRIAAVTRPIHNREHGGHDHDKHEKHTEKVEGLVFDRFGDSNGFVFRGEDGSERRFRSRSVKIEDLVGRAWRQQMLITVFGEHGDPAKLAQVIPREWPQTDL
jgi:hypothetical protein